LLRQVNLWCHRSLLSLFLLLGRHPWLIWHDDVFLCTSASVWHNGPVNHTFFRRWEVRLLMVTTFLLCILFSCCGTMPCYCTNVFVPHLLTGRVNFNLRLIILSLNRFAGTLYQLMRAVERHATDRRIEPAGKGSSNNDCLGSALKRPNCHD
jgi:hypothetical protein